MSIFRPRTLFGRTLLTIAVVSALFQIFALSVFGYFLLFPLGKRATEDLVLVMRDAAHEWVQSPDKAGVEGELARLQLHLAPVGLRVEEPAVVLPYLAFMQAALRHHFGEQGRLWTSVDADGEAWYWADIPVEGETVRLGFPRSRLGVRPPEALLLVLAVGTVVTIVMVIGLVRRLTRPLDRLAGAAERMGRGPWPEPVPEEGAEELASLARSFNRMNSQVQELLANRTTLLAGISHDLRTPLARMGLALEMLPREGHADLMAGIRRDLGEMERLLKLFLDVSRGMEQGAREEVDLGAILRDIAEDAGRGGATVRLAAIPSCRGWVAPLPLRRVLSNLIENAIRYGSPAPVDIECARGERQVEIRISDRGPGIPEEAREQVFRPFYRLEQSRNLGTGGSGLGLAIARQLAGANGWQVSLHAREGGGTCAVVTLPWEPLNPELVLVWRKIEKP